MWEKLGIFLLFTLALPTISFAMDSDFHIDELTEKEIVSLKQSGVWKETCPVPIHRLRIVRLNHWDFEGQEQNGQIMVLDAMAESARKIFKTLHDQKFPLAKVRLMDEYNGDDIKALEDNNTSCFNCRAIIGGSQLSLHAYGAAIDINPIQNPFVQFPEDENQKAIAIYSPAAGRQYANRLQNRPGKPFRYGMAEQVVEVFKENGFTIWGGNWDTPIDYQHFQIPRDQAEKLTKMESSEAY